VIGRTYFADPAPPSADYLRGFITARKITLARLKAENAPPKKIKAVGAELAACKKELAKHGK